MLYIVECSYADPESEAGWNRFYSQHKLPALVSVSGFRASQRFRALSSGCPVYLAIHTIHDADTIASEAYRHKGGGDFARWQAHIRDWRRNLYRYSGVFPAVSEETRLPAAGLDNNPSLRVVYVLPRREAMLLAGREKAWIYEPMAGQLQSPAEKQPASR